MLPPEIHRVEAFRTSLSTEDLPFREYRELQGEKQDY
jgi:hypothetical protein